jgi:hypothetical protein
METMSFLRTKTARKVVFVLAAFFILVLFFSVRIHVLKVFEDNEALFETRARTETAMEDAESFLSGNGFRAVFKRGSTTDDQGFGLVVVMAWLLTGDHNIESIRLFNLGLDFFALLALCGSVWKVFGKFPALIAAFLYSAYVPMAVEVCLTNVQIYQVHFAIFLLCLFLLCPRRFWMQMGIILVVGLLSILASMVRGTFSLYPVALALFLLLRDGFRKGVLLVGVLLVVSLGGMAFVKTALKNPTHPVSHNFFIGLGDIPNPFDIQTIDSRGWTEARNIQKNVDLYSEEYLAILRARTLTLIDEAPEFYTKLIGKRVFKVLFGAQENWWFFGFGADKGQKAIVNWLLFVFFLAGLLVAYRNRTHDSFAYLLTYFYFALIVVPVITSHPDYYFTASVMQIPFASLALSQVRFSGFRDRFESPLKTIPCAETWAVPPYDWRFIKCVVPIAIGLSAICYPGFLWYAGRQSEGWRTAFIERVENGDLVKEWKVGVGSQTSVGSSNPVAHFSGIEKGAPYLFHSVLEVERGRVGLQVRDESGASLSGITYSSRPGRIHCFVGWFAKEDGNAVLHAWDPLPCGTPLYADDWKTQTTIETYRHYRVEDHAKREFCPTNRLEVSSTLFPNGHHTMPFSIDKLRWDRKEPLTISSYWAAKAPCSATLVFSHDPEVSQMVFTNRKTTLGIPRVWIQPKGSLFFRPMQPDSIERGGEGKALRFFFQPVRVSAIAIRFDSTPVESGIAYLDDISLPDAAEFEVVKTSLYRLSQFAPTKPDEPEGRGYPTHLSFLEP